MDKEELFAMAQAMDTEEYCMLESDTSRVIVVPDRYKTFGVEEDTNVERVKFKFPKIVGDNVDLTTLDLRINFQNASGGLDKYVVDDVAEADDGYITFSWVIQDGVTPQSGQISFVVQAVKATEDGTVENKWSTTLNKIGQVLEGLEVDETIEQQNPDIIESILTRLDELEENGGGGGTVDPEQIKQAVNGYLEENPPSGMTAEEKEQLDKNTEDINSISEEVDGLVEATTETETVKKYTDISGDETSGVYTYADGVGGLVKKGNSESRKTVVAPIIAGNTYKIECEYFKSVYGNGYGFIDSSGNAISIYYDTGVDRWTKGTFEVNAPTNAVKVWANGGNDVNPPSISLVELEKKQELKFYVKKEIDEKIKELSDRIDEIPSKKCTFLFICDQGYPYDNRAEILDKYNFKGTFSFGRWEDGTIPSYHVDAIKQYTLDGHDISLYVGAGNIPENKTTGITTEWYDCIKKGVELLNSIGIYPTQYCCSNHTASDAIYDACKKLGFKYCSCGICLHSGESWEDNDYENNNIADNSYDKFGMRPYVLPNRTWDEIKAEIDLAVQNNYVVPLFSHLVEDIVSSDINTSTEIYEQTVSYVRDLVDAGKAEVYTMHEFYNHYYSENGREVELQNSGTAIQWRYVGDNAWTDLVQLSELKGDPGNDGITPNIQIGTVQTLEPGQQATASVTGTTENPLLNLGIPKGGQGPAGDSGIASRQEMQNTDTVVTLEPNKLYVFPEMASLTITLGTPSNANVANEYHFFFTSGAAATTLTLNDVLSDAYSIEANMKYEVSILENVAYIKGVSTSET